MVLSLATPKHYRKVWQRVGEVARLGVIDPLLPHAVRTSAGGRHEMDIDVDAQMML